jgi:hypothetical protein
VPGASETGLAHGVADDVDDPGKGALLPLRFTTRARPSMSSAS